MKRKGLAMSMPAGILLGVGVSVVLLCMGCAILTSLVSNGKMDMDELGYGSMAVLVLSSLAGSSLAMGKVSSRLLLVCSVTVAGFLTLLFVFGTIVGGTLQGVWATVLSVMIGGGISLIPKIFAWGSGGRKRKLHHYR